MIYCANHDGHETLLHGTLRVGRTMGSSGMTRAAISVALSAPSPAAFSPHETVSLTIQLIYPEELSLLFQYCRTQIHCQRHAPQRIFITVDREAPGLKFVTIRVSISQATGCLLVGTCQKL
jgi:hypothetical protein